MGVPRLLSVRRRETLPPLGPRRSVLDVDVVDPEEIADYKKGLREVKQRHAVVYGMELFVPASLLEENPRGVACPGKAEAPRFSPRRAQLLKQKRMAELWIPALHPRKPGFEGSAPDSSSCSTATSPSSPAATRLRRIDSSGYLVSLSRSPTSAFPRKSRIPTNLGRIPRSTRSFSPSW
ncbi:hypothetical protein DIPPA_05191 [Diplonema papillatum]|nr:hypothetical protein DIPPA_05191 [Diplonema papillatum]